MWYAGVVLLGLVVGVLVGLMGIGGGVILVPAMVYLLAMDQHMAQGTSLFLQLPPLGAWCNDDLLAQETGGLVGGSHVCAGIFSRRILRQQDRDPDEFSRPAGSVRNFRCLCRDHAVVQIAANGIGEKIHCVIARSNSS